MIAPLIGRGMRRAKRTSSIMDSQLNHSGATTAKDGAMFGRTILVCVLLLGTGSGARADTQEHDADVREACHHVLSPAMATEHPDFERRIYNRCIELQLKVMWRLRAEDWQ